jgi:hypothetical protein
MKSRDGAMPGNTLVAWSGLARTGWLGDGRYFKPSEKTRLASPDSTRDGIGCFVVSERIYHHSQDSQRMKKTRYPNTLKLGITPAQAKWIKQQAAKRALSEAQVVRTAVDHARGCVTVHQ